jgi:hypothetical protein
MSKIKQKPFEQWYKEEYDPSGYLYPSAPLNIGFQDYCARVNEYLQYLANAATTEEKQCNLPVVMPRFSQKEIDELAFKWSSERSNIMEMHFIIKNEGEKCNEPLLVAEMETVPRRGESITLPVNEGGKSYLIDSVDYLIKQKKQSWIRIWVVNAT